MEQLGINTTSLLLQVVNFALLVFLLQKFLYKPIIKKLEERSSLIAQNISREESLKKQEETLLEKEKAILKKAKEEAQNLLSEAKKDAQNHRDELLKSTKKEAEHLMAKLQSQSQAHLETMKQQLKAESSDIAAEMVRQILSTSLTEADHRNLIKSAISRIDKSS